LILTASSDSLHRMTFSTAIFGRLMTAVQDTDEWSAARRHKVVKGILLDDLARAAVRAVGDDIAVGPGLGHHTTQEILTELAVRIEVQGADVVMMALTSVGDINQLLEKYQPALLRYRTVD
jgi:hypothetical protein